MIATAYSPDPESTGPWADGVTATGVKAGYGIAAVDPDVIPLGTRLYIPGYGHALAADVGGAIKGNRIDLCFDTHQEAVRFGSANGKRYTSWIRWAGHLPFLHNNGGWIVLELTAVDTALASPAAVRRLAAKYGFTFRRSLGQNFLIDGNILRKIIHAAEISRADTVIEVGAGIGTLTRALGSTGRTGSGAGGGQAAGTHSPGDCRRV